MSPTRRCVTLCILSTLLASAGCQSPYYADRGAAFGGLTGAGVGALVGEAVSDNPLAGAAIGAGVGAFTGAAAGGALDEIQAENRAAIAAQMGRQVPSGAATINEVVSMTKSGVDPRLITTYVETSGLNQPLTANDIIFLHEQGVATEVIQAMHKPRPQAAPVRVGTRPASPVIIEEHVYPAPFCPPRIHYRHHHRSPRVGWGIHFSG